jgi:hypothetical protein
MSMGNALVHRQPKRAALSLEALEHRYVLSQAVAFHAWQGPLELFSAPASRTQNRTDQAPVDNFASSTVAQINPVDAFTGAPIVQPDRHENILGRPEWAQLWGGMNAIVVSRSLISLGALYEVTRVIALDGAGGHPLRALALVQRDAVATDPAAPIGPTAGDVANVVSRFDARPAVTVLPSNSQTLSSASAALVFARTIDDGLARARTAPGVSVPFVSAERNPSLLGIPSPDAETREPARTRVAYESGGNTYPELPGHSPPVESPPQEGADRGRATPMFAGLLVDVASVDLVMLEQGLQRFLGSLGSVGAEVARPVTGYGWSSCLVTAVAASLVALEVARRSRTPPEAILVQESTRGLSWTWYSNAEPE